MDCEITIPEIPCQLLPKHSQWLRENCILHLGQHKLSLRVPCTPQKPNVANLTKSTLIGN